ncbi:MAG: TusE/DsrC/DsvC family sulfur relay protein [Deltaproteobacteria bacterium]|nr:TusE/DsrC/DsvC family sulfur relay protein [Deltaproteobacteria bacterium]
MALDPDEQERLAADLGRQVREIGGREIFFDWEGFFWDAADWSEEIAEILARESGMEKLEDIHWKILRFFRDYYAYHGRAPLNRHLREGTKLSLGEIESLFPGGIRLGARRLAGLPNPKSCF